MRREVKYIIASQSYLIRKGIIYLMNRLPGQLSFVEVDTLDELIRELSENKIHAYILDNKLLKGSAPKVLEKFPGAVLIYDNGEAENQLTDIKLSVLDTKKESFNKLLKFHQTVEPSVDKINSEELSEREKDVLRLVALGKTNKEVAEELFISLHTVITHRKNITGKLGIKTVAGLTVYALINGLVKMEEIKE